MKLHSLILLSAILLWLAGCGNLPATPATAPTAIIDETPSPIPHTETPTLIPPTATSTSTPEPTEAPYCDALYESYTPAEGFKLYCDEQFKFAFEYPLGWEVEGLGEPTPDPTARPEVMPQRLLFHNPIQENYVYVYTHRMPPGSTLQQEVLNHWAYADREYHKDYAPMRMGGKAAYGFVNRYVTAYSGCTLFFEHGDGYYTEIELKILSPAKLDLNWQIARSLQVPGTSPADNLIPDELIEDSYKLL